jgi:hypothetical protein
MLYEAALDQTQRTIIRAEKNRIGKAFLHFIEQGQGGGEDVLRQTRTACARIGRLNRFHCPSLYSKTHYRKDLFCLANHLMRCI